MADFQGPFEARDALLNFIIDRTAPVPSDVRDKLRELLLQPSPVAAVAEAVELIYARREEVPPELATIAADAAVFCASFGFHGLNEEARGSKIALVLKRDADDLPEGATPIAEEDEPVAAERYVPAPVEDDAPADDRG